MQQTRECLGDGCKEKPRALKAHILERLYKEGNFEKFAEELQKFSLYLMLRYQVVASREEVRSLLSDIQSEIFIRLLERPCKEGANFTTYIYSMIRNIISKFIYHEVKRKNTAHIEGLQLPVGGGYPFVFEGNIAPIVLEAFCLSQEVFDEYLAFIKNEGVCPLLTFREERIYKALARVILWRAFL